MNKHGLYDIYGGVHVPFWQTRIFLYGVTASFFLLIILIIWLITQRKKQLPAYAWTKALDKIEALKNSQRAVVEHGKEFYGALTDIIKNYLQERYGYESIGKTDEELIQYLQQNHFSKDLIEILQEIFLGITIIKFANAQAAQEQIDRDMQRTILFIKRTIPSDKK